MGWIAIDLDGTLAGWGGAYPTDVLQIGPPIPRMIEKVTQLIAEGQDVRIFTARVGPATCEECLVQLRRLEGYEEGAKPDLDFDNYQRTLIETWCQTHLGRVLPITCTKDWHMWQLWDDRCVEVVTNSGQTLREQIGEGLIHALQAMEPT